MSKFYAVAVGKERGLYRSWAKCSAQVTGYKGALYKSFKTREEAVAYLSENGVTLAEDTTASEADTTVSRTVTDAAMHTIYCDGGHNKFTGKVAYACVVDGFGADLLQKYHHLVADLESKEVVLPVGERRVLVANFNDVTTQQNNGAELLGMCAALRIAQETGTYDIICCDAKLITEYWSKRLAPAKARKMDPRKVAIIEEVIASRCAFEKRGGTIVKISGDHNPADLGFHK